MSRKQGTRGDDFRKSTLWQTSMVVLVCVFGWLSISVGGWHLW